MCRFYKAQCGVQCNVMTNKFTRMEPPCDANRRWMLGRDVISVRRVVVYVLNPLVSDSISMCLN